MKKTARVLTALILIAAGGVISWLLFSIPNDLRAETALRAARDELSKGNREAARSNLHRVVEQYPRTDAASTAVNILFTMADQDRMRLVAEIEELRTQHERDSARIRKLEGGLNETSKRTEAVAAQAEEAKKLAAARPTPTPRPKAKPKPTPRRKRR
jgi:hypothetical protein